MRRLLIVAIGMSVLGTGLATDAGGACGSCRLKGSRTVVGGEHARIYRHSANTFGCLYSRDRRYELGAYDPRGLTDVLDQRNFRLAGRYVAFEDFAEGKGGFEYHVVAIDLRTGRRVHDVATAPVSSRGIGFNYGIGPTTGIQLRATGAMAWIARDRYADAPRYEVWKRERRSTRLAEGPDIDPMSLRLMGARLSWTSAGRTRHAVLR